MTEGANLKVRIMTHTPHDLSDEFPDQLDAIHTLKMSDAHFAKLTLDYHNINRSIHRAETDVEPTDDVQMIKMRKMRLALKDAIAAALRDA
jgi:hypothetical protein